MLKKEETLKGAIVEVFQIKKGVAGGANGPNYVLVTKEAGGFFDGGKGVGVGTRLEIVDRPKRRNGISTVIVKFPLGEGEGDYVGHVYWCELRASCRLVSAAPQPDTAAGATTGDAPAKKKKDPKVFTDKQLARLPAAGYWVENAGNPDYLTFYCVRNGAVKYQRPTPDRAGEWWTLLWSCCPTVKQIAAAKGGISYEHFADHAALVARYPAVVKAPNDD